MKTTGYEAMKQQQQESALRADTQGVFGPSNVELGRQLQGEILRYVEQNGQTTAAQIYEDLECDDIPMYLALRYLVGAGYIVGPDPYSTWAPNDHREMVYISKPLYWLVNGQSRQGWKCTRHDDDPGLLSALGTMLMAVVRWFRALLFVALVLVLTSAVVVALESVCHAQSSTDVQNTVRKTSGSPLAVALPLVTYPTAKVKVPRRKRFKNPATQRYAVRSDRWYGCDKNKHGLWVCTIQLETLMAGKHPTCKCLTQRSKGRLFSRCWCSQ